MADYFKILTNAIADQGLNDPASRQALYAKVGKVLDAQLEAMGPEKAAAVEAEHRGNLDNAIKKIESEFDTSPTQDAKVESPSTKIEPAPAPNPEGKSSPLFRAAPEPVAENDASGSGAGDTGPASATGTPTSAASVSGPAAATNQGNGSAGANGDASGFGTSASGKPYVAPPQRLPQSGPGVAAGNLGTTVPGPSDAAPKKTGGGLRVFLVILLILILAGAGLAFWQRDKIDQYAGPMMQTISNQISSLMGSDDAGEPAGDDPQDADATDPANQPATDGSQQTASSDPADTQPAEPAQPAPVRIPDQASAFLLVEGNAEAGVGDERIIGGTQWVFDAASGTLTVNTTINDGGSTFKIEIAKNNDPVLPASHTLTMTYVPSERSQFGPIVNFPAVMTRDGDEAQSVPLRGAGALIVPNQYLFGLSNTPEDIEYNNNLLQEAKWMVVPVVYHNNRRGLFVVEKNGPASEVFSAAQAAWGQTVATQ